MTSITDIEQRENQARDNLVLAELQDRKKLQNKVRKWRFIAARANPATQARVSILELLLTFHNGFTPGRD